MKSTTFVFIAAALFAQVTNANLLFLNSNWTGISPTQSLVLRWRGNGTPVNISLDYGPEDNMQFVRNITVNNSKTRLSWRPSEINTSGNYSLTLYQSGLSMSSPRFEIIGVVSRIPATVSVDSTMSSKATAQSSMTPSDMPEIVVIGRKVDDEARPLTAPASLHRLAVVREVNGTGSNTTGSDGIGGALPSLGVVAQGAARALQTNFLTLGLAFLLLSVTTM